MQLKRDEVPRALSKAASLEASISVANLPLETNSSRVVREYGRFETREAKAAFARVDRKLKSIDVIDVLSDLFVLRGVPEHIRSDNGPKFVAKTVQEWITAVGAKTAYIAQGSPWENGYIESFKARPPRR
jgi:transposase InsO family protein